MISQITKNSSKKLKSISFPISQSVVIIGPNNSRKSTIFKALSLWEISVTNFLLAQQKNELDRKDFVVINKRDLFNSPKSDAKFLWSNRYVSKHSKEVKTQRIKIEIELEGETNGKKWFCKTEFGFVNTVSFTSSILSGLKDMQQLYENDKDNHFRFLKPMLGISLLEDKLQQGAINQRLGEGKTALVLRNICYEVLYPEILSNKNAKNNWGYLCKVIEDFFGATLNKPVFIKITGSIQLEYYENRIKFDISSAGRGFQKILLLLAYMYALPNSILLLDELDAHLEVIHQREIVHKINQLVDKNKSQIILASHSKEVLEEAAESPRVIGFIENRAIELNSKSDKRYKNIRKSLIEIG